MELDERKKKILHAIIRNYQETGEPVGSRTISKYSDLKLSSATIRNEMADLEEMGLIIQPHTSAGRIPTDKGYRLYVDQLFGKKPESEFHVIDADESDEEQKELPMNPNFLMERMDRLERVLKQMAKILAANTNYTSMISGPRMNRNKLKFLQLSLLEERKILAVIVAEGNLIKNSVIDADEAVTAEELLSMNLLLNTNLNGLAIEEINLSMIASLKQQAGAHSGLVEKVLDRIAAAMKNDNEDYRIYTSGATNIFNYPELSDSDSARGILSTLEEKEELRNLLSAKLSEGGKQGIQVYIGDEAPVPSMKDCSVVTATYDLGGGMQGKVGIVGPKRMDYEKAASALQSVLGQMDDLLYEDGEEH